MLRVNPLSLGEEVRKTRERRHLTQLEAARELRVSQRTIQAWECEDVMPQPKQRRRILQWIEEAA